MSRHFTNAIYLSEEIEEVIKSAEYLGKGNNGVVYRIDKSTIIKIFNDKKVCEKEREILIASKKCSSFPKIFSYGDFYVIREYVDGIRLDKYLRHNNLNRALVENLVALIDDFRKLRYKKLDIRCKDLYVQPDFSLKVIDPKNNYDKIVHYPTHLMKGIFKRGKIGEFFFYLKDMDEELYRSWNKNFKVYIQGVIKE